MSASVLRPMTVGEFLEWEARQELRYEFDGEQPVAMNGGTIRHGMIVDNVRAFLRERLRGQRCRPYGSNLKIEVLGRIRYPDLFVSSEDGPEDRTVVPEPVVVFEVLSPSTSAIDRSEKLRQYQATASIRRYVILDQDSVRAIVYARGERDAWTSHVVTEGAIDMPEIGVTMILALAYEGTSLLRT